MVINSNTSQAASFCSFNNLMSTFKTRTKTWGKKGQHFLTPIENINQSVNDMLRNT